MELTLPPDLQLRLEGLGEAIAASSEHIQFAYLFGSAATGRLTPRSDIDVAIYVSPGADAHAIGLAVARAAARQLATDAVDVVLLNTAPVSLAGRVLGRQPGHLQRRRRNHCHRRTEPGHVLPPDHRRKCLWPRRAVR